MPDGRKFAESGHPVETLERLRTAAESASSASHAYPSANLVVNTKWAQENY
jgi:hypothetical protein